MRTIHKWKLQHLGLTRLPIGKDAIIRHVGIQDRDICVWVELTVNEAAPNLEAGGHQEVSQRAFVVYGTGHDIQANDTYVGTVQESPYVWHVYEMKLYNK